MTNQYDFGSNWQSFLASVANSLRNELVRAVPVDTGALKNSITTTVSGDSIIVNMEDYGFYVEFGTAPHIIKPKSAKSLHWKKGSNNVFTKIVHHPGTQPQPFIRSTMYTKVPRILQASAMRHL